MTSTMTETPESTTAVGRRATWALWGTAAGALGVVANLVAQPEVTEQERTAGSSVVEQLNQGSYHLGAAAGFAAVACLVLFAAGFRRWAQQQASDSLALHAVPFALLASAGSMIAAYGVKGQLAAYLEGGFNDESYPAESLYTYFLQDDLAGFFSWWGVAVAAGCLAVVAFRDRLVVRWVGVLGALVAASATAFLVLFGFTGYAGVVGPVFLVLAGIGMSLRRE
jgi:hypothetical protein